ncbi:carboxylate--amine ligase [Thalassobacillus sp. B23F22_16]|uniref:carboxylate--amine ligase n=1 Tax=Thalassobacillus sp. B23F22_16 TaxID=3459513 RepID=UPI00373F2EC4
MPKVLVTDCNSRKALCAVRSLGKKGYQVIAACDNKINMSRFSKYCSKFHYLPNPVFEEENYLATLTKLIREHSIDVLVPMEDETVELIINNRDKIGSIKTLLPGYETFMLARDKGKTIKYAIDLGVSCPYTYFPNNIADLEKLKDEINYPVIIKPRMSSGSRGLSYVENKKELITKYKEIHSIYPLPIIQQYVSGNYKKIQILLMTDEDHKVKASCTYQGIREFPVDGGPVTLWKTVELPEIENQTIEFMEKINWVGFAEVEYIVDYNTGKHFLMEINPRFSANIALAVNVGIDFPFIFSELSLSKEVGTKINNKFNEYCQWLLPGDLLNFAFNKKRFNQEIGYFFNKPKNISYAILSKEDPLPTVATVLSTFINLVGNLKNLQAKLKASK